MNAIPLQGLRVFCAAARTGSFKTAAEEMFVTASAVSHRIKNLEEYFGQALFERQTRAIKLTDFGVDLLDKIEPLLTQIDVTIESLSGLHKTGSITVTLPPFFSTELFIPRLHEFTSKHQNIVINLDTHYDHPDKLQNASDLSILLCEEEPEHPGTEKLFSLTLVPVCSPYLEMTKSTSILEIIDEVTLLIHRPRRNAWKRWYNSQGYKGKIPANVIVLDNMFSVVKAAEQGLGIALVPELLIRSSFATGSLEKLPEKELITGDSYYLLKNANSLHNKKVDELQSWILKTFKISV